jgi:hypothetical protein
MNTVKFHVPRDKFKEVHSEIRKNKVRHYPIRKVIGGYTFEIDDHPLASFLVLKYDLNTLN